MSDDVTIEYENGDPVGVLRRDGKEFREALPTTLDDYTPEKQRYWMRRCLVALDRQYKSHLAAQGLTGD